MVEKLETVSLREENVLTFWNKNKIFERSENGIKPNSFFGKFLYNFKKYIGLKKEFVFFDGPPFATGLPHYGHILASSVKDAIPRYKTMQGYIVRRQWGWDCHGLPLEVEIEKLIGTKNKKEVEEYGIEKFNQKARDAIFSYADEWKKIIPRIGRWVDMENDYRTVNTSYTESVWNVFHRLYKNGYVKEGFKTLHLCPRCATTISNSEVSDSYETLSDNSVYVAFPIIESDLNLIAWTTTPWTLLGNVALAVNEKLTYKVIESDGKKYVLHENAIEKIKLFKENIKYINEIKGSELVGKKYTPPFDELHKKDEKVQEQKVLWSVINANYVDESVGTGIVHLAPAYGAEDMELAQEVGLPIKHHVNENGEFVNLMKEFSGMVVKKKGNPKDVDEKIFEKLKQKNIFIQSDVIEHSYPVCWRCSTPLLNYAKTSWLVEVPKFIGKLVSENKKVKWIPSHLRDGRFGNWISNAVDWSVSRSRFWGAPIPVWKNEETGKTMIISSIEEMMKKMKSKNKYIFVRHGESTANIKKIFNCEKDSTIELTEKGRSEAMLAGKNLKKYNPTKIVSSEFKRAIQTAEHISKEVGVGDIEVMNDFNEIYFPEYNGNSFENYKPNVDSKSVFTKIGGGESRNDIYKRVDAGLKKLEEAYDGETIVVVTHKTIVRTAKIIFGTSGSEEIHKKRLNNNFEPKNAECVEVRYANVYRDEKMEVDLHRPYIDNVVLYDEKGLEYKHIKEVFDCWFESGSMPYGAKHYPFENLKLMNPKKKIGFPADFICEGLDQTRGWFYSLMAIGVGAFGTTPYKHVITTGLIRASDGKKMSKSLKNYTDPMILVEKHGADSLRHYLLGSPVTNGQDLDFSDSSVDEIQKKVYTRLLNCYKFYETYKDMSKSNNRSSNVLDKYILGRLSEFRDEVTDGFENYELFKAVPPIVEFVDDLSTWYLRRSRDRLKDESADGEMARKTMYDVLLTTSKLIAPIAPFFAEHMYQLLISETAQKDSSGVKSVHLEWWPDKMKSEKSVLTIMKKVRNIVSESHEKRFNAQIKVRQPLQRLTIPVRLSSDFVNIIKDEVNVKEIVYGNDLILDTSMTKELLIEGNVREVVRHIQQLRKEKGYQKRNEVKSIEILANDTLKDAIEKHLGKIKEEVMVLDVKLNILNSDKIDHENETELKKINGNDIIIKMPSAN